MRSKKDQTGEILIDHTFSPGISPEWAAANGALIAVPGGKKWESGVKACSHCGADVYLNPMRTRSREWCMGCDKYICDACGYLKKLGRPCKTLQQQLEEAFSETQKLGAF